MTNRLFRIIPMLVLFLSARGNVEAEGPSRAVAGVDDVELAVSSLMNTADAIAELPRSAFKGKNSQRAFDNKLNATLALVEDGSYEEALDKTQHDLVAKTDGCAEAGASDRNDWVIDCPSQRVVHSSLLTVLRFLGNLVDLGPAVPGLGLRIMTYNTAFMSITASLPPPSPSTVTIEPFDGVFSGLDYEDRAVKIAEGILRVKPDVVVLNEVFSDTARQELINALKADYPNYVSRLRGFTNAQYTVGDIPGLPIELADLAQYPVEPLGSGLMIFSRFTFGWLGLLARNDASCGDALCQFDGRNAGHSLNLGELAFAVYPKCKGLDCLATKGVGLVKLNTPGIPTFVAFTHMQADEDGHYPSTRGEQYVFAHQLLEGTLSTSELTNAPVYFLGDLNTKGAATESEWLARFHPSTTADPFFACGNTRPCMGTTDEHPGPLLTDAWGFETSPTDLGQTSAGGNRLDYVVHSHVDDLLCMQHIIIPQAVAENEEVWYSDHKPVLADFNQAAKWCSPNINAPNPDHGPKVLIFGPTNCDDDNSTPNAPPCHQDEVYGPQQGAQITHPGSFQWFMITEAGSYSIKAQSLKSGVDVLFDVYEHTNLSVPINPFKDTPDPDWGWKYRMPFPPYYIRVYAAKNGQPDRNEAGVDYDFQVHQHLCRSPRDSCGLTPAVDYAYAWPDQTGSLASVTTIFFEFKTSGVKNGRLHPDDADNPPAAYPTVHLHEEALINADLNCLVGLELHEYDEDIPPNFIQTFPWTTAMERNDDGDWDDDYFPDRRYTAPDLGGDVVDKFKHYYVSMERSCEGPMDTRVLFETDLTYLKPGRILCKAQYDDSGVGEDDHIRFLFTFDKPGGGPSSPCEGNCSYEQSFDEAEEWLGQHAGQDFLGDKGWAKGYYVDWFYPNLFEDEDDEDFQLGIRRVDPDQDAWSGAGLSPLDSLLLESSGTFVFADADEEDDADYWYEMQYEAWHEQP
jgi:hypothetical protein